MLPIGSTGAQLTLSYLVPGVSVDFSETTGGIWGSWADPTYHLTFDGELEIDVAVPDQTTIPLAVRALFHARNLQASTGNFFALLIDIEDSIWDLFTGQPGPSGSLADQNTVRSIPALQQLFAELSAGFALAAQLGFVQLGVQINTNPPAGTPPGPTVEFDLTHPFEPASVISNALAPPSQSLFPPVIGTGAPEVNADGQLVVNGSYFPAAQASALQITWTDTTPGFVAELEVQWGQVASGQTVPASPNQAKITRHGQYDGLNTFKTPTSMMLSSNTPYAFRVRDYDVTDFIAMDWSVWTVFTTAATDQIQLTLEPGSIFIGTAALQSDGTFWTTVTVPATVAPGSYELWAALAGQQMAETPIVIKAAGTSLDPVLQIIDPTTGIPFSAAAIVVGTSSVNVRGLNFPAGTVDLFVDSAGGTLLGAVPILLPGTPFMASVTWPYGVTGPHTVLAREGVLDASAPVYGENPAS